MDELEKLNRQVEQLKAQEAENRQVIEAFKKDLEEYRDLLNQSSDPIFSFWSDGRYRHVNKAFAEGVSRPQEEIIGRTIWDVFPQEEADKRYAVVKWVFENGQTRVIEVRVPRSDGDRYYLTTVKPILDDQGRVVSVFCISKEITDRKKAEEQLRESEERYRMILENIEDGYYEVDLSGTFISVNDSFLRIVGYSGEEVIGKNFSQFTDPEAAQKTYRTFHQVFLSGESIKRYEFEFFRKTGDKRYIDVSISMVKSSAGSCQGFRGIARDITDLKAAEEERRNLEARMREVQKLESLGVLAGGIAHDFNNLLMAILGNADLALYSLPPASPTRHNIEEILKVSQRAADLCRQMLAYSGKGRFVIGRYNLGEIIREMTQMLEVSISKKASLRYAIADDLPSVEVDATQMRQIIMNLITNASEALGEQNGLISLSCGAKNCDRAYLADSYLDDDLPAGSYVFLEVSDTGEGMDTETQKRLFEPFYSTKFIGRGLGLAAVLGIVRSHKGAIKVVSERGKGTSFLILLPAVDRAPLEEFSPEEQDKPIGEGGTILLVDDDAHVRQVASEMIAYMGFKVLTAVDGREGLEIFRTHLQEINGVILDLSMPKMGGEEAFREFRQLRPDLPIILSSGYNEQDVIQRFTLDGLDGYLQKPYSLSNLREVLERVLDGEKRNDLNEDQSI